MTEEKADQIIRCVKECWWRIAILLLIPVTLAVWMFSNEQNSEWKLGWTALAAIGSIVAAAAAFYASLTALKISEMPFIRSREVASRGLPRLVDDLLSFVNGISASSTCYFVDDTVLASLLERIDWTEKQVADPDDLDTVLEMKDLLYRVVAFYRSLTMNGDSYDRKQRLPAEYEQRLMYLYAKYHIDAFNTL